MLATNEDLVKMLGIDVEDFLVSKVVLTLVPGIEPKLEITRYVKKPDYPNQTETVRAVLVKEAVEVSADLTGSENELKMRGIL